MSLLSGLFGGRQRTYSLEVDYDVSVEELVRRGEFQWVAEEWHTSFFTSANYPSARTGHARLKVHLISCKGLTAQEGLNALDLTEYRPATLHELLAFGKAHPMLQKEFPVVAPGTQVQPRPDHELAAPELSWGGLGRILHLQSMTSNKGGYEWMLLAVSKE